MAPKAKAIKSKPKPKAKSSKKQAGGSVSSDTVTSLVTDWSAVDSAGSGTVSGGFNLFSSGSVRKAVPVSKTGGNKKGTTKK